MWGSIVKTIGDVVLGFTGDKRVTDEILGELQKQENEINRLLVESHRDQNRVNLAEGKHRSIFVAGWRPFVGWSCGFIFLWSMILRDLIVMIALTQGTDLSALPLPDTAASMTLLMGMLGMGGLRTFEKLKGKTV